MEMETDAQQLLAEIRREGIHVWIEEDRLRFRAPKGAMTEDLRSRLRANRSELLAEIRQQADRESFCHEPGGAFEPFPLTDIQTAYLLGRRPAFAYGGVGCHGYLEFVEDGRLDVPRLERAWNVLIERHPMTRAVFDEDGTQRVLTSTPRFRIEFEDAGDAFEERRLERRARMSHRVYEASRWPLFSVAVTQGHDRSVMHVSFDLLVADFVSFGVLLDELERLHDDPSALLPPLQATFKDYLTTVRAATDPLQYEQVRDWWRERAPTLPPRPELPAAPPKSSAEPRFRRCGRRLPGDQWRLLQEAASARSLTCSTLLLAAFCEVVSKWSRSSEFTIALPLLDRRPVHPQVNAIVGDFTALTLFAARPDPAVDFLARAVKCQEQLWADLDHRAYSGVELAREIARQTGESEALFPVVFTSTVGQGAAPAGTQRWAFTDADYAITQTPQVWLDCQIFEGRDGLHINWDYRAGVLREDVVAAMSEAFYELLARLARDPSAWGLRDPVSLPPDQLVRRRAANDTAAPESGRLLHQALRDQCRSRPDAIAVISPHASMTYGQMLSRASAVARRLYGQNPEAREPVAVILPKGPDQIAAVLGVLLAGRAYVPVDTYQPSARQAAILRDAGVRDVIVTGTGGDPAWPADVRVISLQEAEPDANGDAPGSAPASGDDLAYIIYTGGSTGTPKGVMIRHSAAENTIDDLCARLAIGPADRVLGLSHLGFDLSVFDIFGILGRGGTLVLPDPDQLCDPSHWYEMAVRHGVTIWNSVPAQMQMLVEFAEANLGTENFGIPLRQVLLSGDWIPTDLPDRIWSVRPDATLLSLGGATEASIWSVYHEIEPEDRHRPSIPYGRPLRNQEVHVLDAGLRPRPDWVAGDLYIGGKGLADGYVAGPDNAAFVRYPDTGQRLYRTGDLCRYLDDGELEFLGREDLQVKIRGHRIELSEVEAAALMAEGVGASVAVAVGDRHNRNLALAVEPEPGTQSSDLEPGRIAAQLSDRLPPYMVPQTVEVMDRLPLTRNNKIDRKAVAGFLSRRPSDTVPGTGETPFASPLEEIVGAAFSNVLGLPEIGASADFLDLGGNSLLAARAASEVRALLEQRQDRSPGFDELLIAILEQRTVRGVATHIERLEEAPGSGPVLTFSGSWTPAGSAAALVIALDDRERTELEARLQPFSGQVDILSVSIRDASMLTGLEPSVRVEWAADTVCTQIEFRLEGRTLIIISQGDRAAWALEIGRRLRESGCEVILAALDDPGNGNGSEMAECWSAAVGRTVFYPYLGQVLVQKDVRLNVETGWEEIALGSLSLTGGTSSEVIRAALDAAAS